MWSEETGSKLTVRRDPLRVGIVGTGEAAQIMHLPSLRMLAVDFEVRTLCDADLETAQRVAAEWGIADAVRDYQEILGRDDIDVVLVSCPDRFHAPVILDALRAGKHVLAEKPMCLTVAEADEILETLKQSGRRLQVGYVRTYASAFARARTVVRALREINLARVNTIIGANELISRQTARVVRGAGVAGPSASRDDTVAATLSTACGVTLSDELVTANRLLLSLAIHDLSAMRELLGFPKDVIYARWFCGGEASEDYGFPIGRTLTAAFDYETFVCHLECGVCAIPRFDARIEVFSPDEIVQISFDTPFVRNLPVQLRVEQGDGTTGYRVCNHVPTWDDPFVEEWRAFKHAIEDDVEPAASAAGARDDIALIGSIMERLVHAEAAV
ncbi:MAG TPA: Gfo/Idh/MocA family oxidoreductase [Gaiellaceae bacterium]|nr:Gfo/Idh/MocA family oxidoreductase [Gaiellaceae bacterium]